eukprot:RCo026866
MLPVTLSGTLTTAQELALAQWNLEVCTDWGCSVVKPWQAYPVALNPAVTNLTAALPFPIRGLSNAPVSIGFNLPQRGFGNEIRIQFPSGFNLGSAQVSFVVGISLPNATVILPIERIIQLRWTPGPAPVVYDWARIPTVEILVEGVGLPNSCGPTSFTLTTHSCYTEDLMAAGVYFLHRCQAKPATDIRIAVSTPFASPTGCTLCNACNLEFTAANGDLVYSCLHDGVAFTRVNVNSSSSCSAATSVLP